MPAHSEQTHVTLLSHYTSRAGLEGIARTGTLWATDFMNVKGTSEYFFAWNAVQRRAMEYALARVPPDLVRAGVSLETIAAEATEALRAHLTSAAPDGYGRLYMTSFARGKTEDHDRRGILTLWRHYTKHEGYCLQFEKSDIDSMLRGELTKGNYVAAGLAEMKYGVDEDAWDFNRLVAQVGEQFLQQIARAYRDQRIKPDYDRHWAPSTLARKLMDYCGTRKDPCFEDEREMRIYAYPADGAEVRGFTGIASRKEICTAPSGMKYIALGEFWRPAISPKRIIVGSKADRDISAVLAQFNRMPEINYANMPDA